MFDVAAEFDLSGITIGPYHFRHRLGRGGFASVYLAEDMGMPGSGRLVAIKVFSSDPTNRTSTQQAQASFQRDIRPLIDGASASIVTYHTLHVAEVMLTSAGQLIDLSRDRQPDLEPNVRGRRLFLYLIVMEYADGGHLGLGYRDEVIVGRRDSSYVDHFVQMCEALLYAHSHEIVHCDIKPQNVFFFRQANLVKVGDFGIAKYVRDSHPGTTYLQGTLPYLAPETFTAGVTPLPSRDVYALGCTFYELLTGRVAFALPTLPESSLEAQPLLFDKYATLHQRTVRPDAFEIASAYTTLPISNTIKQMMSSSPADRPGLDRVIATLRAEASKVSQRDTISLIQGQPPVPRDELIIKGTEIVNPTIRSRYFNEACHLFFVVLDPHTENRVTRLYHATARSFKDVFSFYEVFGRVDFVISAWCTDSDRVRRFLHRVNDDILDNGHAGQITAMRCDDVTLLGRNHIAETTDLSAVKIRLQLGAVQASGDSVAASWLKKYKVFVGKSLPAPKSSQTRCFTSVRMALDLHNSETNQLLLERALESAINDGKLRAPIMLYRKGSATEGTRGFDDSADFIVEYMAPSIPSIVRVPEAIHDKLRCRTTTLLATLRYYIQNEHVQIDGRPENWSPDVNS